MYKKTIEYKDYNGVDRKEDFYFNLTEAELTEMELSTTGGLEQKINQIISTMDMPSMIKIFKDLIAKSYGQRSPDGRRFMKKNEFGKSLFTEFEETEAFSKLYMELATDDTAAADFVNGIIPSTMQEKTASVAPVTQTNN